MILPWESTLSPRWNTTRDFVIFFDVCRELPAPSKKETLQKTLITTYISIDGGLQPVTDVLLAIARSFASYTAIRCVMGSQGGGPDGPKIDGMEVLTGNGGFKTIHSKSADFDSGFICCLRCGMLQAVWWICFNTSILEWQFIDVGLIMVWLVSRLLLRPSIPQMMPNATHEISWMNYWVGSWRRGSLRQPKRRHVRNTWMHSRRIPTQSVTTPENQLMTIQLANFLFEFFPFRYSESCIVFQPCLLEVWSLRCGGANRVWCRGHRLPRHLSETGATLKVLGETAWNSLILSIVDGVPFLLGITSWGLESLSHPKYYRIGPQAINSTQVENCSSLQVNKNLGNFPTNQWSTGHREIGFLYLLSEA